MKHIRKSLKNKRKNRRTQKRNFKNVSAVRMLGVNAAGLKSKLMTFKKVLEDLDPSVFLLRKQNLSKRGYSKWTIFKYMSSVEMIEMVEA